MKKTKILIIEDDKWLADYYKMVLQKSGYKATVSLNAIEAMDLIDKNAPDAIILDVLLSGSTAFALMHELMSYEDTAKIPIILCTNLANEFDVDKLKPYGVRRILDKSTMMPDDLVASIRSVLM